MPLNPDYRSAFEEDEAHRAADATRQQKHAQEIREQSAEANGGHSRDGFLDRVVASPPLRAEYRAGQLALWVTQEPAPPAPEVTLPRHPFQILDASVTENTRVKGYVDSKLFDTTDFTGDGITITNLTTTLNTTDPFVDYLEITLDSELAVVSAVRKNDAGWSGFGDMFHVNTDDPDNPFIDKVYVLLALVVFNPTEVAGLNRDGTVITDGSDFWRIIQFRRNHIYLEPQFSAAGLPVLFPVSAS